MNLVLTIVVIVGALAMIGVLISRRNRQAEDGVAEFRRQLNALKPESRRPLLDAHPTSENDETGETTHGT